MCSNTLEVLLKVGFGGINIMILKSIFRQDVAYFVKFAGCMVTFVQDEVINPFRHIHEQRIVTGVKTIQHMRKPDQVIHVAERKQPYDV